MTRRDTQRDRIDADRVLQLARQGLNGPQIAQRLGRTRGSIYRILKSQGTTIADAPERKERDVTGPSNIICEIGFNPSNPTELLIGRLGSAIEKREGWLYLSAEAIIGLSLGTHEIVPVRKRKGEA